MNPENDHISDDHWDDERLTALFAAADSDGVPPDRKFLERLRERSTEAFAAAGSQQTQPSPRRLNMFAWALARRPPRPPQSRSSAPASGRSLRRATPPGP